MRIRNLKKSTLLVCTFLLWGTGLLFSQSKNEKENASYLTMSGAFGSSSLNYKLNSLEEKGTHKRNMGFGIDMKYSYFFHTHWGVTTGVGISRYSSTGKLKGSMSEDTYYNLGMLTDDDWRPAPKDFELHARLTNLEERQNTYLLEIPLMASYRTYCNEERTWGLYGGLGAKLQIPISSKFKIRNGANSEFNVSGKYDGIPTDAGSPQNPPVPQHGYGTITDPNAALHWNGKAKLKMGVAATAEFGVLFSLGQTTDLQIGGYIDYGLINMKKNGKKGLFTAPSVYHPSANSKVGEGIRYNGMLNSDVTGKIRPVSFGVKVALAFQLGGR